MAGVDLTGQRFGRLTALEPTKERRNRSVVWHCRCDCGEDVYTTPYMLRSGKTRSCGCLRRDVLVQRAMDLKGKRFGRLEVLEKTDKRDGRSVVWHCRCDCGNVCDVASDYLVNGDTRSCGCLARESASDALAYARSVTQQDGTNLGRLTGKVSTLNKSGMTGVRWDAGNNAWRATIGFRGQSYYLGLYKDVLVAAEARREAEEAMFDPMLESHGWEPTSEDVYQERVKRIRERLSRGQEPGGDAE